MANNEKETNVVENESPTQLQKVSDKVPVAKREVIEVNKDTINAINLFDEKQLIAAENFLRFQEVKKEELKVLMKDLQY